MLKKIVGNVMVATMVVSSLASFGACGLKEEGPELDSTKTVLEIANQEKGMGDQWIRAIASEFEKAYADYEGENGKKGVQVVVTNKQDELNNELLATIGIVAVIGIVYTLVMFFISKPLTAMEREEKTRGMMRFSAVFTNNGFLGIPLAMAVFGAGSRVLMVVIIINIITNILMYTLGIYLISGDKSAVSWNPKR